MAYQRRIEDEIHNSWQGDQIPDDKSSTATRLLFHNVRHLPLYGPNGLEMFTHSQSLFQIDIQAFSEHCLDTTKFSVTNATKDILRRSYSGQATIQIHSSAEPATHQYKPGGTGLLVLGHTASRIDPHGRGGDPLGRWSYISFRRQHFPPLTIISVYQVCPRPTNLLGNTAYHQQQRALAKLGRHIHPRTAFLEDILKFLTELKENGHNLILGGDFNEALQDRNAGVLQIATRLNLVDPFLHRFPQYPEFGTHESGQRRIDIALVSPAILPCIQAIGYAPFQYINDSDHRPLILDLTTAALFGTSSNPFTPPIGRIVKSKDKAIVTKYISTVYDELQRQRVFQLLASLDDNTATPETVERIDSLIGLSEDIAEKKCKPRRPEFYSQKIVQQRITVSILKRHLSSLQRDQDRTTQILNHMTRTGVMIALPPTQALTREALRKAQDQLRETCQASFDIRQTELDQKINDIHARTRKPHQKILKAIKKTEQNLKTFRVLKAIRSANTVASTLNQLEIPASWPAPIKTSPLLDNSKTPRLAQVGRLFETPTRSNII